MRLPWWGRLAAGLVGIVIGLATARVLADANVSETAPAELLGTQGSEVTGLNPVEDVDDRVEEDLGETQAGVFADDFKARTFLPGSVGQMIGNNAKATLESGEPRLGGKRGGHSVWLGYRPVVDGVLILSTDGSRFDTILGVYRTGQKEVGGASFALLKSAAFGDDDGEGRLTSKVVVSLTAGEEYAISIDGYAGAVGDIVLTWAYMPRLAPAPSITWVTPSQSVPAGMKVGIEAGVDSVAGVQFQWLRNGAEVPGGTTAAFEIQAFEAGDVGQYRLRLRLPDLEILSDPIELQLNSETGGEAAARDKLYDALESPLRADRSPSPSPVEPAGRGGGGRRGARLQAPPVGVVRGMNGTQVFNTTGATRDPDEPLHCGEAGGASYWFAYEAVENGTLHFDAEGTAFPAVLAVYTFTPPLERYDQLVAVTCDIESGGVAPSVEFRTEPGQTYLIVVDGVSGARGLASLNYRFTKEVPPEEWAPVVVLSPASRLLAEGGELLLSAEVTGTAPLGYLWRREGEAVPGATSAELRIPAVTVADEGGYRLEVTNRVGAATSVVAVVQVRRPPRVVVPLADVWLGQGDSVELHAAVSGSDPLVFQWFKDGDAVEGATRSVLTLDEATSLESGGYQYVVTNMVGAVTSIVARVEVIRSPVLTALFTDQWIEIGTSAVVEAPVDGGEPLTFRWFRHGTELPGVTGRRLTILNASPADTGGYHFEASNPVGSVTSVVVRLEVVRPPVILAPLADRLLAEGSSVVLQAEYGGDGPFTFRWYRDGVLIPGVQGPLLPLNRVTREDAGAYSFDVLNPVGFAASAPARLEVQAPPGAVVTPALARRVAGGQVRFDAAVTGDGPLQLQWFRGGTPMGGMNGPSLLLAGVGVADAGEYRLHVTNAVGVFTDAVGVLEIIPPPRAEVLASANLVRVGDPVAFELRIDGVEASGHRWFRDGVPIEGATTGSLALTSARLSDAGAYRVEVETELGPVLATEAILRVAEPVRVVSTPGPRIVALNSRVTFEPVVVGTLPFSWQWRKDGVVLAGETNAVLVIEAAPREAAGLYEVTVSNAVAAASGAVMVLGVVGPPRIIAGPASTRVGAGGTARLAVEADAGSGGRMVWLKDGVVLAGMTGPELVVERCDSGHAGEYLVELENLAGLVRSPPVRLDVVARSGIRAEPETARVIVGMLVGRGVPYRVESAGGTGEGVVWTQVTQGVGPESGLVELPFLHGVTGSQFFRYAIGTPPGSSP